MLEKNIPMIEAVAEVLNETKENLESKIEQGVQEIAKLKEAIKGFDEVVAKSSESLVEVIKEQDEKSSIEVATAIEQAKEEFERKINEVSKSIDETMVAIDMVSSQSSNIAQSIEKSIQEVKESQSADFEQLSKDLSSEVEKRLGELTNGSDGADGIDGKDGVDGRDRPLIEAMVVESGDKIDKNTVVAHKGGLFISTRKANGTPNDDPAGFNCVLNGISDVTFTEIDERKTKMLVDMADGLQVEHIIDTHSPVFKGPFKKDVTYEINDIVIKDKKTLIKVSDEGEGEWKMFVFAEKGEKGDTGAGIQGEAGVGISDIFAEGSNILFEMTDGTVKAIGLELPDLDDNFEGAKIKAFAGEWDNGDTYSAGDVVRSENGLWLALDTTSEFPSAKSSSWINMIYAGGSGGSGGGAGEQGPAGPAGTPGKDGVDGVDGVNGLSAYEIAVADGFVGTETEWIDSLQGIDGQSAYEIAVAGGFVGTEQQWLDSLVGADGASAYEVAVAGGYAGTEAEWVASLKGEQGVGLRYVGRVATAADLNAIASPVHGDIYIAEDTGNAHVWNSVASSWDDAGPIVGAEGPIGPQGEAGPTAVSADANNGAYLGTDNLIYVPNADGVYLPLAGGTMVAGSQIRWSAVSYIAHSQTKNTMAMSSGAGSVVADDGGVSLNGPTKVSQDPVLPLEVATKQYVDTKAGAYLPLAGGQMTGVIATPTTGGTVMTFPNTYSMFTANGGVSFRFGASDLMAFNSTAIYAYKPIITPSTGTGIQFGSGGADIRRGANANEMEIWAGGAKKANFSNTAFTYLVPNILSADPTQPLEAATKQYVDSKVSGGSGAYLPLAGGTMSGPINFPIAGVGTGNSLQWAGTLKPAMLSDDGTWYFDVAGSNAFFVEKTRVGFSLPVELNADPTQPLQAATKKYVDSKFASGGYTLPAATTTTLGGVKVGSGLSVTADGTLSSSVAGSYLPLTGGTMSGAILGYVPAGNQAIKIGSAASNFGFQYGNGGQFEVYEGGTKIWSWGKFADTVHVTMKQLQLPKDPVNPLEAATKQYVDAQVAAGGGASSDLPLAGGTMTGTITLPTTIQSLLWGASTYNMFGANGGVAIRYGTANIVNFTATSATYTQKITTAGSGIGIEFGSSGAYLSKVGTGIGAYSPTAGQLWTFDIAAHTSKVPVVLPADPTADLQAATKKYVDAKVATAAQIVSIPSAATEPDASLYPNGTLLVTY